MKLLKILEVSNEQVESRYQESNKIFEIKKINLQSWLSESINKDKTSVLTELEKKFIEFLQDKFFFINDYNNIN